ncbi:hypothetical protein ACQUQU_06580 [Thalassolituus sp. LLYu03]|uniref:hypothetical protein n=1 Tax=Thalassolituus sp. LLYu03 TaxID=3421656 RepID=UPI003D2C6981
MVMKALLPAALLVCIGLSPMAQAMPKSMQNLRLKDQNELPVKVSANIRYVLFAHDMSSKDLVQEMLADKPADYLDTHHTLFVADISGMPRIIARMFAYPSLRKLPYQVLLDEVGARTENWERRDSAVTLFRVDNFTVTSYDFIDSRDALEDALNVLPPSAPADAAE